MRRLRIGLIAIAVAGTAGLLSGAHSAADTPFAAATESAALAAAPSLDTTQVPIYTPAEARAAADRDAGHVPLPHGGNVNGIRWEEAGGLFSYSDVDTVVQYNAFCQWLRAARDDPNTAEARGVLDAVPDWPGFRDQPDDVLIREVVAEAQAGAGPDLAATLTDCDRSHDREVVYARGRGLIPST